MREISLEQFKELISGINELRPFKMYLHSCPTETVTNIIHNGQNFGGMNNSNSGNMRRNSISSTVVYGGTAHDDISEMLSRYEYLGNSNTLIMIMPSAISVDNYIGSIEGQKDVGTNNNSHIYLDYSIIGYNKTITNDSNIFAPKHKLDGVHNSLFLGYYNRDTNTFILNDNCILLSENNESYLDTIFKAKDIANRNYQERITKRILTGDLSKDFSKIMEQIEVRKFILDNIPLENIIAFSKELYDNSREGNYDKALETEKLLVCNNTVSHLDTAVDTIIGMLPDNILDLNTDEQSTAVQEVISQITPNSIIDELTDEFEDIDITHLETITNNDIDNLIDSL